ncbi:MAG: hypothetical protein IPM35_30520 [Myxococcales bacterium]|nr:hypothetical protein [Myxococcales bacterium]
MTVLFALIPSFVALAIFVGTFRLTPPRVSERSRAQHPSVTARVGGAIRTPLPLGAARRSATVDQLRA